MSSATRPRPARSDVVGTAILGAIGVIATIMGISYGVMVDGAIGPGFLPAVAGGFIVLASLAELIRLYRAPVSSGGMMSVAEAAEAEAKESIAHEHEEDRDTFGRTSRERNLAILKIFGLMLAALLLIPVLGLLLALTAMVLAILLWVERKPIVPSVLAAAGALAVAYLIFVQLLGVPVPVGILGF